MANGSKSEDAGAGNPPNYGGVGAYLKLGRETAWYARRGAGCGSVAANCAPGRGAVNGEKRRCIRRLATG